MEAASALPFTQCSTILLQIITCWVFLASVWMISRYLYIAKPSQVPLPQQEIAKLNNYKESLLEAVHVMV